jgi:subtilisin family serine protease
MSMFRFSVIVLAIAALWAAPSQAQDDTNIAEIKAAIARDGSARVIVEMTLPDAVTAVERSQSEAREITRDQVREKIQRRRSAVAERSRDMKSALAQSNMHMEQEYENLPMFTTTVDTAKLERLMRMPRVKTITLDKPVSRRQITLPAMLLEKVAITDSSIEPEKPLVDPETEIATRRSATTNATDDPETAKLSNTVTYINADKAWARGYTGQGQTIAVLDEGIDPTHEMFLGKIVAEACYSTLVRSDDQSLCPGGAASSTATGAASVCNGSGYAASCEHGSHVAGIAAGNDTTGSYTLKGVAYGATLMPIQVFTRSNNQTDCDGAAPCLVSYSSAILNGLNFVISQASTRTIAAVNISIGGAPVTPPCDSDVRKSAIDTLRTLGILTAIAAGNEGQQGRIDPPGCISTAITVSSTIITTPDQSMNHGPTVDVLAPGFLVNSADAGTVFNYTQKTGTSMATPHAAGAIAILKSAKPTATADQIEAALKNGGISTTASGWTWSTPRLDVNRSLDMLNEAPLVGVAMPGVFGSRNSGGTSYLRFFNPEANQSFISVQIYDDLTGSRVATWTKPINGMSSPQFSMAEIEAQASPVIQPVASTSQFYTLFVDALFAGYAQHVLWSPQTNLLSNVTLCDTGIATTGRYINNTHTTLIGGYTSYVLVHNTGSAPARPSFNVRDARNGTDLGTFSVTTDIKAHTSSLIKVSDVLQTLGRTPDSTQFHLNLIMNSSFTGFAQHWVRNEAAGTITSLAAKCDI